MEIERTAKQIIIKLPASVNTEDLQDFLNYARYKEITSKYKISQKKVDEIANKVNKGWWKKNREKLTK